MFKKICSGLILTFVLLSMTACGASLMDNDLEQTADLAPIIQNEKESDDSQKEFDQSNDILVEEALKDDKSPNVTDEQPPKDDEKLDDSVEKVPEKSDCPPLFYIEDRPEEAMILTASFMNLGSDKQPQSISISKEDKTALISILNSCNWESDTLKLATELRFSVGDHSFGYDYYDGSITTAADGGHHTKTSTDRMNAILAPYLEENLQILTDLIVGGRFWLYDDDVVALKAFFTQCTRNEEASGIYSGVCEYQFSLDGTNYRYSVAENTVYIPSEEVFFTLNEADQNMLVALLEKYPHVQ